MENPNVAAPLTSHTVRRHQDAIDQIDSSGSPALAGLLRNLLEEVQYLRSKDYQRHHDLDLLARKVESLDQKLDILYQDSVALHNAMNAMITGLIVRAEEALQRANAQNKEMQ